MSNKDLQPQLPKADVLRLRDFLVQKMNDLQEQRDKLTEKTEIKRSLELQLAIARVLPLISEFISP